MKKYNAYLIDLDGTMYRGNEVIEDAPKFVEQLRSENIPHLFVTNNSSRTPEAVSDKLNEMGIASTPDRVFTTSMATAKYIRNKKANARCYVIGEEGLFHAINKENLIITDEDCDFVVLGIDREITYEKLTKACLAIRNGATFISTNGDIVIPTERGLLPGNGSFSSLVTVSTGVQPIYIGKPETIIIKEALTILGTTEEETLMVGDNYDTDIKAGYNAGVDTLMVFTGVTPYEELANLKTKPTYHVQHLHEWLDYI